MSVNRESASSGNLRLAKSSVKNIQVAQHLSLIDSRYGQITLKLQNLFHSCECIVSEHCTGACVK